jgi:hypothetical protein
LCRSPSATAGLRRLPDTRWASSARPSHSAHGVGPSSCAGSTAATSRAAWSRARSCSSTTSMALPGRPSLSGRSLPGPPDSASVMIHRASRARVSVTK